MGEWIQIDARKLFPESETAKGGFHLALGINPYDVPQEIRGWFMGKDKFAIEFSYIAPEPVKEISLELPDFLVVYVGKNSQRIHRIEVGIGAIRKTPQFIGLTQAVQQAALEGISSLGRTPKAKPKNVELAEKALVESSGQILEELQRT